MKFKDLVIYNLLVESFQEEGLLLIESIRMSQTLIDVFKDKNLEVPEEVEGVKYVELKDDKYATVHTGKGMEDQRIVKVLNKIWPGMSTTESNQILGAIRAKLNERIVTFTIEDNVSEWYKSGKCGKVKSCMTDKPELTKFYDTQDSLKIVIAWRNKEPIARALLWYNVENKDGRKNGVYLDRVYPHDSMEIIELFRDFADKNKWWSQYYGGDFIYQLENMDKIDKIPYLDTFKFGGADGKIASFYVKKTSRYEFNKTEGTEFIQMPKWLAITDIDRRANFEVRKDNFVVWNNGEWNGGTWEDGIWKDGIFNGGIWKKGTWEFGEWHNGTWEDGTWLSGVWLSGVWEKGEWSIGWILDRNKVGNFKPEWRWNGDYVNSPINPKEYFAK